jgi:phosphate/sulfate permease
MFGPMMNAWDQMWPWMMAMHVAWMLLPVVAILLATVVIVLARRNPRLQSQNESARRAQPS